MDQIQIAGSLIITGIIKFLVIATLALPLFFNHTDVGQPRKPLTMDDAIFEKIILGLAILLLLFT